MNCNVEFIVPTLKRPEHLTRCLASIAAQTRTPVRVLVGVRADDQISRMVVQQYENRLDVRVVEARGVGVVGSMNSCLAVSAAPFIAFLDDDVELPLDWMEKVLAILDQNPNCVGVGGRDFLQDHPAMRAREPLLHDVGHIHWYGRITGNHHRGGGVTRPVSVLRGSNCLFRGNFLRSVGFERRLRGQGAQVNWELALALQANVSRKQLIFAPEIIVIHHVAPRHDNDSVHRGVFDSTGVSDIAHNETFVVLKHAKGWSLASLIAWQLAVGSTLCPGLLRLPIIALREPGVLFPKITATIRGRLGAVTTLLRNTQHAG